MRRLIQQGLFYSLALTMTILGLGGVGFWVIDPQIHSLSDGLWLAFTTAATVGFGDLVPSTPASRIFAVVVVLLGLAVLSLVTASLSAIFVEQEVVAEDRQIEKDLLREIARLREDVAQIHRDIQRIKGQAPDERPTGNGVGRAIVDESARERYLKHLLSSVKTPLKGLKIVVDCANGAASTVSPEAYRRAGAEVISIFDAPNGWNINDGCGSTHLEQLRTAVLREGADFGVAHDGDADRVLAIDAHGAEIDGDVIMTILARGFKASGSLKANTIVATVMSNL